MDIKKFIKDRPYLYHLTCQENAEFIIKNKVLLSANELLSMADDPNAQTIQKVRREEHFCFDIKGEKYYLRDQRPISLKALSKCLTDGWTPEDFIYHLNDRVFMWPTLGRLNTHFERYQSENPVIFRFPTEQVINLNPNVKFCRLNSGATRANSYLGGIAPPRGSLTFQKAEDFAYPVGSVAEVTFEKKCLLNLDFEIGRTPSGSFKGI